jgi:hypothetical protein
MRTVPALPETDAELRGVVGSVLCAVEPTLSSLAAARQAAELARGGRLELVPVEHGGAGMSAAYVAAARYVAARHGTVAVAGAAGAASGSPVHRAGRDDLLVVGAGDDDRLSALARAAVTGAAAPVLVARPPHRGADLGDRPLLVGPGDDRSAEEVVHAARAESATIIVLARTGASDPFALLVAARAPCSVLVGRDVRPSTDAAP